MALGQLRFTTPMLFAVGLVSQFVIGGLSGVMHASVPIDTQHNDSYFVVAHFHYVLFGGSIFGLLAAIYYWFPKFTGRLMDERLGRLNFWTTFVGFNLTFFPMHFLGLEGMPRRYSSYGEESGWWFWNVIVSLGSYLLAASILLFLFNAARSLQRGRIAGPNPWDAATLEWSTTSPPPVYNFRDVPHVTQRDPLWAEKYGIDESETEVTATLGGKDVGTIDVPDEKPEEQEARRSDPVEEHTPHLPNPSYWPPLAAIGFFLVAFGLIIDNPDISIGALPLPIVTALGLVTFLGSVFGWSFEPAD
jgi:cytochrome c oxidase subunit 1